MVLGSIPSWVRDFFTLSESLSSLEEFTMCVAVCMTELASKNGKLHVPGLTKPLVCLFFSLVKQVIQYRSNFGAKHVTSRWL